MIILDLLKEKFQQFGIPVPMINDIGGLFYAHKIDGLTVWYVADYKWPEVALYGCLEKDISNSCYTVEYDSLPDYQKKYCGEALNRIKMLRKEGLKAVKLDAAYSDPLVLDHDYNLDVDGDGDLGINAYFDSEGDLGIDGNFDSDDPDDYKPNRESYTIPNGSVDLNGALSKVNNLIGKYVDLDPLASVVLSLWIVFTWVSNNFYIKPLLIVRSDDEHHDNMSVLFTLLLKLTNKAEKVTAISRQHFFKNINNFYTLIFDDPKIIKNCDMQNLIINSYRCDEAYIHTGSSKRDRTSGAKALASYGGLPHSISCRGIVLDLTQRNNDLRAARLKFEDLEALAKLNDYMSRLTSGLGAVVRNEKPVMPDCLSNKEQDNWEPLFKIAMVAGGNWLDKVTQAAIQLSAIQDKDGLISGLLLTDIHEIVRSRRSDRIRTKTLIRILCEKTDGPWSKYNRGGNIESTQIADLMKKFGIKSRQLRFERLKKPNKRGYLKNQIENAYKSYTKTTTPKKP